VEAIMTRVQVHGRLTALAVKHAKERGVYPDGQGLLLQIARNGSRSWILRYRIGGRRRYCGLGALPDVTLAQARERAAAARLMLDAGQDPIEVKKGRRAAASLTAARVKTFQAEASAYMATRVNSWAKSTADDWKASLVRHVYPTIGSIPVADVDAPLVLKVVEPIWSKQPETGKRVLNHIAVVLDFAKVRGYRVGENPAIYKGNLDKVLAPRGRGAQVKHHPALPYAELPEFLVALRKEPTVAACALEFTILTAARSAETLNAAWQEIDLANAVWVVPGVRMKEGKSHRVPLSNAAVKLLEALPGPRVGIIFPGTQPGKPLNKTAMSLVLRRLRPEDDTTVHGMRSAFSTWAAERTTFPHEVIEQSLAHVVGSQVSRAYSRTDRFEDRARLMAQWADFCDGEAPATAEVIELRARA
jgi:integrase